MCKITIELDEISIHGVMDGRCGNAVDYLTIATYLTSAQLSRLDQPSFQLT